MGEKGSIKNLYKAWRLFLEGQKKKKLEKQKNKKASKIKVFGVTFFTFLLSPFFFSSKKEYKKTTRGNNTYYPMWSTTIIFHIGTTP